MYSEILIISIAFIGLIIATLTDIKSREVPDYLNYFLIVSGFGYRLFYSILYNNFYYFLYGLLGFGITFLVGVVLYLTKQWGGGDTKLLMALGVIFATKPFFIKDNLFLLNLILNIFLSGAIYSLFYGIYLAIKNRENFLLEFKNLINTDKIKFIRIFLLISSVISGLLALLSKDFATIIILLGLIVFLLFYVHLWIFVKSVENACMFKIVPSHKLTEGDWIVDDILYKKKLIYKKEKLSVDKKDILRIINSGIKNVKIKEGIPFVPSFLIGTIITILFGSLFF